jgi:hypothetical protein
MSQRRPWEAKGYVEKRVSHKWIPSLLLSSFTYHVLKIYRRREHSSPGRSTEKEGREGERESSFTTTWLWSSVTSLVYSSLHSVIFVERDIFSPCFNTFIHSIPYLSWCVLLGHVLLNQTYSNWVSQLLPHIWLIHLRKMLSSPRAQL